ncbi:hypothetical protein GCM10022247_13230 [Allokutzneria multivorans]|uniref:Uncharacterized protein n=1 Tax=Allokutzneria multivorans TaxID=1142134 RepID=A0ABP7RAF8_9PSEU
MSSDALFGPDGTQAPPPPPSFPDALSAPAELDFVDQPKIAVRPPGLPDPDAVQRAVEQVIAAERAPVPKQRPRQRRQAPVQQPMRPMQPMPPALPQPQPQQQAKPGAGCGISAMIFFGLLLLGFILNVAEHLFP